MPSSEEIWKLSWKLYSTTGKREFYLVILCVILFSPEMFLLQTEGGGLFCVLLLCSTPRLLPLYDMARSGLKSRVGPNT